MALYFERNKDYNQGKYSFPAFVPNTMDVLYEFNDQTIDLEYIKNHKYGEKAIQLSVKTIEASSPENRVCNVSGNIIRNPDSYIFTGLLTSDEKEELYLYNFITLDKNNLDKWVERDLFISVAKEFISLTV
jgi:hypothetical protein